LKNLRYISSFYTGGWRQASLPNDIQINVIGAACSSTSTFVAIGDPGSVSPYSAVVRSNDAGHSWYTALKINVLSDLDGQVTVGRLFDIAVNAEKSNFIAVAETGQVYHSLDDGETWVMRTNLPAILHAVSIGTNGIAFVVGTSNIVSEPVIYTSSEATFYSV